MATYTLRHKKLKQDPTRRLLSQEEARQIYVAMGKGGLTLREISTKLGRGHHTVSCWLQRETTVALTDIETLFRAAGLSK